MTKNDIVRSTVAFGLGAVLLLAAPTRASADTYPAKPIRFLVGFAPGGVNDLVARALAARLSPRLTQQVVVENRPGAGGNIATELVARAAPDGYTMLLGSVASLAMSPALHGKVPFDPIGDFAPIAQVVGVSTLIAVHPSTPARSLKEFVALAKKQPGKLNFGSSGHGNLGHFAGEMFKANTGIDIVQIPYKGGNEAMMGLLGGSIDILFPSVNEAQSHVASGGAKAIGVMSDQRTPLMPDVPTLREQGINNAELASWNGIVAPAGTPPAVVTWLNEALNDILVSPAGVDTMKRFGTSRIGGSVADFRNRLETENIVWTKLIATAGIEKAE